ncbi:MAG: helix-turn-helix domain-containing protein [bacterium]
MKQNIENKINMKLDKILKVLDEKEDVMSSEAACEYLSISINTLYSLVSKGKISYFKSAGNKLFFTKSQLDEWAKFRKVLKKCQTAD